MALDLGELLRTTRRAAIVRGGLAATAMAALAGLGIGPAEAKKKKKKKKKKSPPPQVVAQLIATNMTGAKEFPGPGDGEAFDCSATFVIKSNGEICCNFTFNTKTPDSEITLTHIHQGVSGASGSSSGELQRRNWKRASNRGKRFLTRSSLAQPGSTPTSTPTSSQMGRCAIN